MNSIKGKKILLIITKSNWGGAQAYVYSLAKNLSKYGAEIVVGLGGTGMPGAEIGLLAERLRAENISVEILPSFSRDISIKRELKAFYELRNLIKKIRPDIVHLNSSKAGGLGALAARLEGIPTIVFTAHGWAHREPRSSLKKLLILISSWGTIALSTKIIVVSKKDRDDAPVFIKNKIQLVRNGISPFILETKDVARGYIREKNAIPQDGSWILMQSELHTNKGIAIAIEAFSLLLKKHANIYLVIIGEGEERTKLESQIEKLGVRNNIFLVGFIPDSRKYLLAADIFLMTSYKEGLPMAILEAGFARLPVVASSTGGIPEVISNSNSGLLVEPGDVNGFYTALQTLLVDASTSREYGDALGVTISKEFSEERMISETISIYSKP